MKKYTLIYFLLFITFCFIQCSDFKDKKGTKIGSFKTGNKEFLLNGKPFLIRAGELHYPRIPKEYWEHRIKMVKAMGMNTICIYTFWNFHEEKPDEFNFTGQRDIAEFVRLSQKHGMYVIVRPGPYVCAEWDMGGLPWWLLKKDNLKVRNRHDSYFMERSKKYIEAVGKELAPYQIQKDGNIIMVQIENEYAGFNNDAIYMEQLRNYTRKVFDKVQLFRCDWGSNFDDYDLDDVAITLNFGAGANVDQQFSKFKEKHPNSPLMCSEYWTGWFDHWGRPHATRSIESFIGSLKDMLDRNVSFSLFMAHGGTTFGQWGGGNAPPYSSMLTSYDYNAPINEAGQPTDKFYAVRNLLKNYLNENEILADVPDNLPVISIPEFELKMIADLFDNLPKPKKIKDIKPIEMLDQGWGSVIYRTVLPKGKKGRKLVISEVHDWAAIYINKKLIANIDRRTNDRTIILPKTTKDTQLDILVEALGRVNFGEAILDRKGITKKVELVTRDKVSVLKNWDVFNLPVDIDFQRNKKYYKEKSKGPGWYKSNFYLDKVGDTHLNMEDWKKGMVWVNGHNLGRYWQIGPQQTLYVPGSWLKKGENEIIVFSIDGRNNATKVKGVKTPILDKINPDASLTYRKKGQNLVLKNENPIHSGILKDSKKWQTINFKDKAKGRYFCFEALSPQKNGDKYAAIAEIELIGEDDKVIPRKSWKVKYADSEEVLDANNGADKVFDNQESIFWHTEYKYLRPNYPHHLVIDLGASYRVKGMRFLSRTDDKNLGNIKKYKLYLSLKPFKL